MSQDFSFVAAVEADLPLLAAFVNAAYRGAESLKGWTSEAGYIDGERTTVARLTEEQAAQPLLRRLLLREAGSDVLLGCVQIEPVSDGLWYLGMLTVRPDQQDRQLGRWMLDRAEAMAKAEGADRIRMTVVHLRDTLIAWYERRGYVRTGALLPFEFGDVVRDDLKFVVLEKSV